MPVPLGAIITGGASLLGAGINAGASAMQNARSEAFTIRMYEKQRKDALAFWALQNAYDSPEAQMSRYKAAGLNPNLIYGQSNQGAALSAPEVMRPEFNVPRWGDAISGGVLTTLDNMYNFQIKQAQVDNMKAQNAVIVQEALLKAAQIGETRVSADRKHFDLDFESELRSTSAEARKEMLRQLQVTTDISARRDLREQVRTATDVSEAIERMKNLAEQRLNMQVDRAKTAEDIKNAKVQRSQILAQIDLLRKEGVIKRLDADLASQKIRPGDPLWSRYIVQGLNNVWDFLFGE